MTLTSFWNSNGTTRPSRFWMLERYFLYTRIDAVSPAGTAATLPLPTRFAVLVVMRISYSAKPLSRLGDSLYRQENRAPAFSGVDNSDFFILESRHPRYVHYAVLRTRPGALKRISQGRPDEKLADRCPGTRSEPYKRPFHRPKATGYQWRSACPSSKMHTCRPPGRRKACLRPPRGPCGRSIPVAEHFHLPRRIY